MRTLQNNFTTPEQSKRLLELGVPANSADCYWIHVPGCMDGPDYWDCRIKKYDNKLYWNPDLVPSWSVGRLMAIYFISKGIDYWSPQFKKYQIENSAEYFVALIEENIKELDFSKLEE